MSSTSSLWEEKKYEHPSPFEPTPEDALSYTIINTNYNAVKTEWLVIGNQKKRIRRCPTCKKIMVYNSKRGYFNCKKKKTMCRKCSAIRRMETHGLSLPYKGGCKLTKEHKEKISSSGKIRHQKYKHPMTGKRHTEETIKKYRSDRAGNKNSMYGKHHTEETRKKISETRKLKKIPGPKISILGLCILRQKRIEEISRDKFVGNQIIPSFNKKSCLFFDRMEKELGWNGRYATKSGEHQIKELGYFIDYYEPNKNIVIEWDEKRHYNIDGTLINKDVDRQKQIQDLLKCKFIRINEKKFDEKTFLIEIKKYD